MKIKDFNILVDKFLKGEASFEEELLLMNYYKQLQNNNQSWDEALMGEEKLVGQKLLSKINVEIDSTQLDTQSSKPMRLWLKRISIAASILMVIGFAGYFIIQSDSPKVEIVQKKLDVEPGTTKALLTLSNGSIIQLDDGDEEDLISLNGTKIHKTKEGELIYQVDAQSFQDSNSDVEYHVISTPAGARYQVNLPDGSKVWLNSASSLRYPIPFSKTEREVKLTGEGYFEVASLSNRPFIVKTASQTVEVLGTHFNINSYDNEPSVRTTLLEGAVQVTQFSTKKKEVLQPGQQAVLTSNLFKVIPVNVENAIDWKNNKFNFDKEELQSIMRKLARWYNVEIIYEGNYQPLYYSGSVSTSKNLSEAMRIFELTEKVTYRIEEPVKGRSERRVVIMM